MVHAAFPVERQRAFSGSWGQPVPIEETIAQVELSAPYKHSAAIATVEYSSSLSLTQEVFRLFRWLQRRHVNVRNRDEVQSYLLHHSALVDVIPQVVDAARRDLPDASLILTLYRDPEEDAPHLVLYVRFREYCEDTIERIEPLRERFQERLDQLLLSNKGWLFITTDFQPPDK